MICCRNNSVLLLLLLFYCYNNFEMFSKHFKVFVGSCFSFSNMKKAKIEHLVWLLCLCCFLIIGQEGNSKYILIKVDNGIFQYCHLIQYKFFFCRWKKVQITFELRFFISSKFHQLVLLFYFVNFNFNFPKNIFYLINTNFQV